MKYMMIVALASIIVLSGGCANEKKQTSTKIGGKSYLFDFKYSRYDKKELIKKELDLSENQYEKLDEIIDKKHLKKGENIVKLIFNETTEKDLKEINKNEIKEIDEILDELQIKKRKELYSSRSEIFLSFDNKVDEIINHRNNLLQVLNLSELQYKNIRELLAENFLLVHNFERRRDKLLIIESAIEKSKKVLTKDQFNKLESYFLYNTNINNFIQTMKISKLQIEKIKEQYKYFRKDIIRTLEKYDNREISNRGMKKEIRNKIYKVNNILSDVQKKKLKQII